VASERRRLSWTTRPCLLFVSVCVRVCTFVSFCCCGFGRGRVTMFLGVWLRVVACLCDSHSFRRVPYQSACGRWQDSLLQAVAVRLLPQARPWLVYTAGAMGAGKSHCMRWLSAHDIVRIEQMVKVDMDQFKQVRWCRDACLGCFLFISGECTMCYYWCPVGSAAINSSRVFAYNGTFIGQSERVDHLLICRPR
jgi:hypothetical protein